MLSTYHRTHFLVIASLGFLSLLPLSALSNERPILTVNSPAKFVYLRDTDTDVVLISQNAEEKMYPASMTKIMTALVAFEHLKEGIISMEDEVYISKKANRMGGSRMFIEEGKTVLLQDILRGIIVQSGNDASVALAEFLGGDEENFATMMNTLAQKVGMSATNFVNSSGWPDENHYTTAKDITILSEYLIENHPELYRMFAEKTFTYSRITQKNRNPLLGKGGVDGIKTGHTEASGYGMVSTAKINGRRLILLVNGMESAQKRASESQRLLNLGFRSTKTQTLYSKDDPVTSLPVWYGEKNRLSVTPTENVRFTERPAFFDNLHVTVSYPEPLHAPIEKGTKVGQLHIHTADSVLHTVDLLALEDIKAKGYTARFRSNIDYLLWGKTP